MHSTWRPLFEPEPSAQEALFISQPFVMVRYYDADGQRKLIAGRDPYLHAVGDDIYLVIAPPLRGPTKSSDHTYVNTADIIMAIGRPHKGTRRAT